MESTDRLTESAASILELLKKGIESGGTFVMEQLPDICQQLIVWKRVELTLFTVVFGGLLLYGLWLLPKMFHCMITNEDKYAHTIIVAPACSLVGFFGACVNLTPCLQVWFAPKVYLIEYLTYAIKNGV